MKTMTYKTMLSILIVLFCHHPCFGLEIGTVEEPPGNFTDEHGKITGLSVDFVKEIQNRVHDNSPIEMLPSARLLVYSLEKKNYVLFSVSRTPAREEQYHWISLVMRKPLAMLAKKDSNYTIATLDDAKHVESIGVMRGSVTHDSLMRNHFTNIHPVTGHDQNLKKLMAGRISLWYTSIQNAAIQCKNLGIDFDQLEPVLILQISQSSIAISKDSDMEIVKAWQNAAQDIKADGTFDTLAQKWLTYITDVYGIPCEIKDGALNFWQDK
jgi:polar amino acid transport system substrate-binding protein